MMLRKRLKTSNPKRRRARKVLGARVELYMAAKKWDMTENFGVVDPL